MPGSVSGRPTLRYRAVSPTSGLGHDRGLQRRGIQLLLLVRRCLRGVLYSCAYPVPTGFSSDGITLDAAYSDEQLGGFALPHADVRTASDPAGS